MFDDEKTMQDLPEMPEQEQPQEQTVEAPQEEIKVSPANRDNIRELRLRAQRAEQAERERDEAIAYIKSLQQGTQQPEEDYSINIGSDDLVEGKHIAKMDKKVQKELNELKKQLQSYQQQTATMTTKARLQAQFPDFEQTVNADNIALLREMEPEVAQILDQSTDLYNSGVTAYKMIKKLTVPDSHQHEKAVAQRNAAKPKPLASISPQTADSPLSRVNAFSEGLTDDLKKQLYREMIEAAKNR